MLNETIKAGLNNPDCAFFVGNWIGMWQGIKWLVIIILFYFGAMAFEKLMFNPIMMWINEKYGILKKRKVVDKRAKR